MAFVWKKVTKLLIENEIMTDLFPSNNSDNTKQINKKIQQFEIYKDKERSTKTQVPQLDMNNIYLIVFAKIPLHYL